MLYQGQWKTTALTVVNKTSKIVVVWQHFFERVPCWYFALRLKENDIIFKAGFTVTYSFYKRIVTALKTHKFCTFGSDLACRVTLLVFFHGRIAVSVMKEYWANYISLEEGLQSSRFKPGRPSSTKSTNRKMNLIERLLRKSPRNRSTDSPLGKFHPEYLIQPANQWFKSSFQHMLIFWQYP